MVAPASRLGEDTYEVRIRNGTQQPVVELYLAPHRADKDVWGRDALATSGPLTFDKSITLVVQGPSPYFDLRVRFAGGVERVWRSCDLNRVAAMWLDLDPADGRARLNWKNQ